MAARRYPADRDGVNNDGTKAAHPPPRAHHGVHHVAGRNPPPLQGGEPQRYGVFVRTAGLGLRKGQQVNLAFAIDLGSVTKVHRRSAVVAHVSGGGTGLMMDAYAATAR